MPTNNSNEELRAIFAKPGDKPRESKSRRAASTPWPGRMTLRRPRAGDSSSAPPVEELVVMAPPRRNGTMVQFFFRMTFFAVLTGSTALLALSMGAIPEPLRSLMQISPTGSALALGAVSAAYAGLHRLPRRRRRRN
jgi:hypothetical protein